MSKPLPVGQAVALDQQPHNVELAGIARPGAAVKAMLGQMNESAPALSTPQPSLGRIVHFIYSLESVNGDLKMVGKHAACIVTAVNDNGSVNLALFPDAPAVGYLQNVREGTDYGTWHWPERI